MSKRKWYRKKRYISLLVLAGIILLAAILWPFVVPPLVESKLKQRLNLKAGERLELSNFSVGVFPLSFSADSVLVEKSVKARNHQWLLQSRLADLDINLGLWQFLNNSDELRISEINWGGGEILFTEKEKLEFVDSTQTQKKQKFIVEQIDLGPTKVKVTRDTQELKANFQLTLQYLEIGDSSSYMPQWQNINLQVNNFFAKAITPDHNLNFSSLSARSDKQSLVLKDLVLLTRLPHEKIQKKYKHMKVQQDVLVEEMDFNQIELNRLNEGLFVHSIVIKKAKYPIYQDSRSPVNPDPRILPSGKLLKIKYPFRIDTLRLENSELVYEEQTKNGLARLTGSNWNAKLWNLSNIGYSKSVPIALETNIEFYGAAPLSLSAHFDSTSSQHAFTVSGRFGRNELSNFNPVIKPILGLYFESGTCHEIRFEMRGNDERIEGDLFADYTNLGIGFGDYQEGIFVQGAQWTLSQIAINQDEKGTQHHFTFQREPHRSFINYWWNALQKGLMDVMLALGLSE